MGGNIGNLLLLSGLLAVSLLHASEKFTLKAVLGHLNAHEFLGWEYLFESLEIVLLQCGTLDLNVGQSINHLVAILLGALVRLHRTHFFPYSGIGLMLLVLQLKIEREEGCTLFFSELGMAGDKLLLLGLELLGGHTWTTRSTCLLLCRGGKTNYADDE